MKRALQIAVGITVLALPGVCAELAILNNGFSIRHERREVIGEITRLYLSASEHSGYIDVSNDRIGSFEPEQTPITPVTQPPAVQPATVDDFIKAASEEHRIDRALIESVISAESGFNAKAVSRKGAKGLMQLMPATAAELGVGDAFDPQANVEAGTRYLQQLLVKYNHNLAKALAAYNAGPHRVQQYNGVPPYPETHNYVVRVISEYNRKKLSAAGAPIAPPKSKPSPRITKAAAAPAAGSTSSGQR